MEAIAMLVKEHDSILKMIKITQTILNTTDVKTVKIDNRQDTYSPVKRWKKRCCNAPTRQIYDIRSLNSVMNLL